MMEKDLATKEELIWAMRTKLQTVLDDDLESWKGRSLGSISSESISYSGYGYNTEVMLNIVAALLPDEIIINAKKLLSKTYNSCLLFGFMSGFDELCAKLLREGRGAPSKVHMLLNTYTSGIFHEIILNGGDLIGMDDDLFIGIWKIGNSRHDAIHNVLDCSLQVYKAHENFVNEYGITLRLKILIMIGTTTFSFVGNDKSKRCIYFGDAIDIALEDAPLIAQDCVSIMEKAWDFLTDNEYFFDVQENISYIKVLGITTHWKATKQDTVEDGSTASNPSDTFFHTYILRGKITDLIKESIYPNLIPFIASPVMQTIEIGESIELLNETRYIAVLHIQLKIKLFSAENIFKVTNDSYLIILSIIDSEGGCIFRVKVFNKTINILVIFGFHGSKCELDCQRALVSGTTCYKRLKSFPAINRVTCAVTTGLIFCGIVGHTLRKEYIIIGLPVYRASKLIEAYDNTVICDRDTFLHSKMEAKHFLLQDYQYVKGAVNVGPIYKYIEINDVRAVNYPIIYYPILDRDKELLEYFNILWNSTLGEGVFAKNDQLSSGWLIIYGKAMQGKTRLTEEIIYKTPSDTPMFHIQLLPSDLQIPYQTIFLIFSVPLGISEYTNFYDIEAKLTTKLREINQPQLYCLLNIVFKVNFEKGASFYTLREEEKQLALEKIIHSLTYSCFKRLWIIVIDGGEFIDNESWMLLKAIMETYRIIFVITISTKEDINPYSIEIVNHPYVKQMHLKPIHKWFHIGLACQFLEVYGIPPELEKNLQTKSNGNPGWIQSYLITLVQEHIIEIRTVPLRALDKLGLVIPAPNMITREDNIAADRMLQVMVSQQFDTAKYHFLKNKWQLYKSSFKDSTTKLKDFPIQTIGSQKNQAINLQRAESAGVKQSTLVDVCFLKTNIDELDIKSETVADLILKMFDYLTIFEQSILKCSSIIGEIFSRSLLAHLLCSTVHTERTLATAIKHLFELGIIGCARGVFNKDSSLSCSYSNPKVNNFNTDIIECFCIGLLYDESCQDLPKYASCGLMYFKLKTFRDVTYSMLTISQKDDYHNRAIHYLETKTYKCPSCGGGLFSKHSEGTFSVKMGSGRKSTISKKSSYSKKSLMFVSNIHFDSFTTIGDSAASFDQKKKKSGDLRSFISADFQSCYCLTILYDMYRQLRMHYEATEQVEKWIEATLEHTILAIYTHNIPLAIKELNHALEVIHENRELLLKHLESWRLALTRAKIYAILGHARHKLGQLKSALKEFKLALKEYGYSFPLKMSARVKLMSMKQMIIMNTKTYGIGTRHGYLAQFCNNVSECLSYMCKLFLALEMYENAEIAAMWSLKKALQADINLRVILIAFSQVITTRIICRKFAKLQAFESKAIRCCIKYKQPMDIRDLKAFGKLYSSLIISKAVLGHVSEAADIGFNMTHICNSLNERNISMHFFPVFMYILITVNKLEEAGNIIANMGHLTLTDIDYYGVTWYYALCLTFHIDTGYNIIPFYTVENYYYREPYHKILQKNPSAEKRYCACLWLWYLRTEHFEKAEMWGKKIKKIWTWDPHESINDVITALYILEGLLIESYITLDRNRYEVDFSILKDVRLHLKALNHEATSIKIILPRFKALRAYYYCLQNEMTVANKNLRAAEKVAMSMKSVYEAEWVKHLRLAWKRELNPIDYTFWNDHAEKDIISHRYISSQNKIGYYTLRPLYHY